MKYRSIICTIILISVLSITVGFSAFVSEMSISHIVANVRVEKDVRITSVEYLSGEDITINDINYDADSIVGNAYFYGDNTHADYKVTFTNFGNVDMYIEPSGTLSDYIWIADGDHNIIPALGGTTEFIVSLGLPGPFIEEFSSVFQLDFNFLQLFTVSYENLDYESELVADGKSYFVYLDEDIIDDVEVYMNGALINDYIAEYGELVINKVTGDVVIKGPKTLNSVMKMNSVLDTNINFGSSDGLSAVNNTTYTINSTKNNTNPIYYYRGNVTANNVLFNNFCWKMVRTTDAGGVKLIYNGVPSGDGSCDNTGTASQIGKSAFNPAYRSFAYHGYMYNMVYEIFTEDIPTDETIIYGDSISYDSDTKMYTLLNPFISSDWENERETIGKRYFYTCMNDSGTCGEVYYINSLSKISISYIILSEGQTFVDSLVMMMLNRNDSTIKQNVDQWYLNNMTHVTSLLVDEDWCNDRGVVSGGWKPSVTDHYLKDSYFAAYQRNVVDNAPSLTCAASGNRLSLRNNLKYPVGLLTADELTYAGYSADSFLQTGEHFWTMTPWYTSSNMAYNAAGSSLGKISTVAVSVSLGVRPSVVLLPNMRVTDGNGTTANPYHVKSTFVLNGKVYEYEPGVTWREWLDSDYSDISVLFTDYGDDAQIVNEVGHLVVANTNYDFVTAGEKIDSSIQYEFKKTG